MGRWILDRGTAAVGPSAAQAAHSTPLVVAITNGTAAAAAGATAIATGRRPKGAEAPARGAAAGAAGAA